ncbi:hypothetical protein HDV02_002880 [Globomyces sp. JEL0801]|nr:hypothetical protein HDV02_002880 [Globomyces sp. JEL0801]
MTPTDNLFLLGITIVCGIAWYFAFKLKLKLLGEQGIPRVLTEEALPKYSADPINEHLSIDIDIECIAEPPPAYLQNQSSQHKPKELDIQTPIIIDEHIHYMQEPLPVYNMQTEDTHISLGTGHDLPPVYFPSQPVHSSQ